MLGSSLVWQGYGEAAEPPTEQLSTAEVLGEAYRLLDAGRVDEAEARFSGVLAGDPRNLSAREGVVWTHLKSGQLEKAAEEADERLALSSDVAWRKRWIDVVSALPARRPAAITAARALARERPEDAEAYVILARVLATTSEGFRDAVDACKHALTLAPDDVAVRTQLADTLVWSARYPEAIAEYRRVISFAPDPAVQTELARALVLSARYSEAIAEYRQVISSAPDLRVQRELARTLVWAGRYDEAVAEYRPILARLPGDRALRRNLARALASANQLSEAIRLFDALIEEDPNDAEALRERALLARREGDFETARRLLRQATTAKPTNPEVEEELGYIAPRPVELSAAPRDVTFPLLFGLFGFGLAMGQLHRTIDRRTYLLLAAFSSGLVGIGLSWLYLAPGP